MTSRLVITLRKKKQEEKKDQPIPFPELFDLTLIRYQKIVQNFIEDEFFSKFTFRSYYIINRTKYFHRYDL